MPSGNVVVPLLALTAGGVLVWSGITDPTGGTFAGLSALLRGEDPSANKPAVFSGVAADLAAVAGVSTTPGGGGSKGVKTASDTGATPAPASGSAAKVIAQAKTWLGVPYAWGGETRTGVDCSGFTQAVYATVGVNLPRVSAAQALAGHGVSSSQAQPGDLIAFGLPVHHVAIYLGNGQAIHAPHTGAVVRTEPVASIAASIIGGGTLYRRVLSASSRGVAA